MFKAILELPPAHFLALTVGFLVLFYGSRRIWKDYQIWKVGGVRAPVLATNPLTGRQTAIFFSVS